MPHVGAHLCPLLLISWCGPDGFGTKKIDFFDLLYQKQIQIRFNTMVQIFSTMVLHGGTKVSKLEYDKFDFVPGTSVLYRRLLPMPVTENYFRNVTVMCLSPVKTQMCLTMMMMSFICSCSIVVYVQQHVTIQQHVEHVPQLTHNSTTPLPQKWKQICHSPNSLKTFRI
jgi:hypothetical protein